LNATSTNAVKPPARVTSYDIQHCNSHNDTLEKATTYILGSLNGGDLYVVASGSMFYGSNNPESKDKPKLKDWFDKIVASLTPSSGDAKQFISTFGYVPPVTGGQWYNVEQSCVYGSTCLKSQIYDRPNDYEVVVTLNQDVGHDLQVGTAHFGGYCYYTIMSHNEKQLQFGIGVTPSAPTITQKLNGSGNKCQLFRVETGVSENFYAFQNVQGMTYVSFGPLALNPLIAAVGKRFKGIHQ